MLAIKDFLKSIDLSLKIPKLKKPDENGVQ